MRVRWGNLGRALVVVGVLMLAVAWPRLEGGVPRLPSDDGAPLVRSAPRAGTARVRERSGRLRAGQTARVRKGPGVHTGQTARVRKGRPGARRRARRRGRSGGRGRARVRKGPG